MTDQWKELKETITEMRDNDGTGTQQDVCKFLVNLMDVLEKQMSGSEKPNKWIPISERLPKEDKTVIASTKDFVYPQAKYTKKYGWAWAYDYGSDYWEDLEDVTAWMPLPKPYKGESEE